MTAAAGGPGRRRWPRVLLGATGALGGVVALALAVALGLRGALDRAIAPSPEVERAAGLLSAVRPDHPTTWLVIGTDRRPGGPGHGRADALVLVRIDPAEERLSMLPLPRSAAVDLPGRGRTFLGQTFDEGGPSLAVRAVEQSTGLDLNYLAVVDFAGLQAVVDAVGGVYVDVDRRYLHLARGGPGGFAPIDLHPGYQRLTGRQALAFARDRHADSDYFRSARQLELLRALRLQTASVGRGGEAIPARLGRAFSVWRAAMEGVELVGASGAVPLATAAGWLETVAGIHGGRVLGVMVPSAHPEAVRASVQRFRDAPSGGSAGARGAEPATVAGGDGQDEGGAARHGAAGSSFLGNVAAGDAHEREDFARVQRRTAFPLLYPTVRPPGTEPEGPVRRYRIRTPGGAAAAVRATYRVSGTSERWGIQETAWTEPPLLEGPARTERRGGREYLLYYRGDRLHVVAFRTAEAAYWVTNTLFDGLPDETMLAVARSLVPVG